MNFAPFAFENHVIQSPSIIPIITSGLTLYVDAQIASSNPGSGTAWNDISGNNYNPTLYPTNGYTAGPPASFNQTGTTSTLTTNVMLFPAASAGSDNSSYSWGGWINITGRTAAQRFIHMRGDDAGTPGSSGWSLSTRYSTPSSTTWTMAIGMTTSGNTTSYTTESTNTFSFNTWYYIYGTYDVSTGTILSYMNGINQKSGLNTGIKQLRIAGTAGWSLARLNANGSTHNMLPLTKFGSFEVYNRVLSSTEILNNFNATKTNYGY